MLYHLQARDIEHRVLPWCIRHEVAVVGYSPFGSGRFPSASSAGGKVLAEVARSHRVTQHQVTLAFLVRDPHLFAIPKAGDPVHVRDNAAAAALQLTPEELTKLDRAFPVHTGRGLPMI